MKETHEYIKQPSSEIIEIPKSVDFVYVMRLDEDFAMSSLTQSIVVAEDVSEKQIKQKLVGVYKHFEEKLIGIMWNAFSQKGNVEVHTFNPDALEQSIARKTGNNPIISLDPLLTQNVDTFPVSRGYELGGIQEVGHVTRPGYWGTMQENAQVLAQKYGGQKVIVVEDDIFSGASVIASLHTLLAAGVDIAKVIAGIQIGSPSKLMQMGILVDSVIQYKSQEGNIFDKLDLGDPRDFLVGASGLVIALPDGSLGRLPYILPFVSCSERASIPPEVEKAFSLQVLMANAAFYQQVEQELGFPLCLKHMNQAFVSAMTTVYGFDGAIPMEDIIAWSIQQLGFDFGNQEDIIEDMEKIEALHLPQKIVLLDVNGTLFPDDSKEGYIDPQQVQALQKQIAALKAKGVSVGLCSDTPLEPLAELATKIGISGPIVAENGNLIFYNGEVSVINPLPELANYYAQIKEMSTGLHQVPDAVAPEFGGKDPQFGYGEWALGAYRQASISVFGPSEFIGKLGKAFSSTEAISVDCSPHYNFFAIHPGKDYTKNKGLTLSKLVAFGHQVVMVGNSRSDWVEPSSGVQCAFVGEARITSQISGNAGFTSAKPTIDGVLDILQHIVDQKGGGL